VRTLFVKIAIVVSFRVFVLDQTIARKFILAAGRKDGTRNRRQDVCLDAFRNYVQSMADHGCSYMRSFAIRYNLRLFSTSLESLFVAFCQVPRRPWRKETESLVADLKVLCRYFKVRKIIKLKCWRYVKLMFTTYQDKRDSNRIEM